MAAMPIVFVFPGIVCKRSVILVHDFKVIESQLFLILLLHSFTWFFRNDSRIYSL